ncbi:proton-translocating transhydrogenase family protein, partial [Escherichia coli]|uniref:proton-translocating transhydrogenase family protein n=1 Tax=Escherichia coli TaxID=562 RepID=UPI00391C6B96
LMMNPVPWLQMTNMISYQGLVRTFLSFLSFIAVLIASINIFGGFTVTQRMLKMFRKN